LKEEKVNHPTQKPILLIEPFGIEIISKTVKKELIELLLIEPFGIADNIEVDMIANPILYPNPVRVGLNVRNLENTGGIVQVDICDLNGTLFRIPPMKSNVVFY